ncbi:MAG: hypothetical protein V4479_00880, partial [Actinomycetota bacterium]
MSNDSAASETVAEKPVETGRRARKTDVPEVVEVPADTAAVDNTEVLEPETPAAPAVQTVYVE